MGPAGIDLYHLRFLARPGDVEYIHLWIIVDFQAHDAPTPCSRFYALSALRNSGLKERAIR
jgi:hypothetical protein